MQEAQTGNLKAYDRELRSITGWRGRSTGISSRSSGRRSYWNPARLRPVDSGGFWLSETPDAHSRSWETDYIRSAQWIRFRDLALGAEFVHVNTHLDHRSELARVEGSRLIIQRRIAEQHPRRR